MLNGYKIREYKSFEENNFDLGRLNLYSGANSAGKSSAIQALLNAADNLREEPQSHRAVARHTPVVTFNETRNFITNAKSYEIDFLEEGNEVNIVFTPGDDAFKSINVEQDKKPSERLYSMLHNALFYLPAMRAGRLDNSTINPNAEQNPLGLNGEFVIDFYQNNRTQLLPESLWAGKETKTLEGQVNLWLNKLTGYRLIVDFEGTQYRVKFETIGGKQLFPYHVGTGISFITEVIIVCLALPEDSIVIIENPEIHLHPSAQADLIDFLAMVAKSGRQVIVESHSDHLFNGIRRLLHKNEISLEDVRVFHFIRGKDGLTKGERVVLSQQGGIQNYIPGMFEQFDKDLDDILS